LRAWSLKATHQNILSVLCLASGKYGSRQIGQTFGGGFSRSIRKPHIVERSFSVLSPGEKGFAGTVELTPESSRLNGTHGCCLLQVVAMSIQSRIRPVENSRGVSLNSFVYAGYTPQPERHLLRPRLYQPDWPRESGFPLALPVC
jgi:hypothetical protein